MDYNHVWKLRDVNCSRDREQLSAVWHLALVEMTPVKIHTGTTPVSGQQYQGPSVSIRRPILRQYYCMQSIDARDTHHYQSFIGLQIFQKYLALWEGKYMIFFQNWFFLYEFIYSENTDTCKCHLCFNQYLWWHRHLKGYMPILWRLSAKLIS